MHYTSAMRTPIFSTYVNVNTTGICNSRISFYEVKKKKFTAYFSKYPLGTSLSQIIYLASKIYKNKILNYFILYNECTLNFAFTISISVILGIIFRYSATDHDQIKYIFFFIALYHRH